MGGVVSLSEPVLDGHGRARVLGNSHILCIRRTVPLHVGNGYLCIRAARVLYTYVGIESRSAGTFREVKGGIRDHHKRTGKHVRPALHPIRVFIGDPYVPLAQGGVGSNGYVSGDLGGAYPFGRVYLDSAPREVGFDVTAKIGVLSGYLYVESLAMLPVNGIELIYRRQPKSIDILVSKGGVNRASVQYVVGFCILEGIYSSSSSAAAETPYHKPVCAYGEVFLKDVVSACAASSGVKHVVGFVASQAIDRPRSQISRGAPTCPL